MDEQKPVEESQVHRAVAWYSERALLRSAITAIPYAGSCIDVFLSTKGQAIAQERLRRLLDELSNEMKQVKESAVDKDFLNSEAFFDLLCSAVDASSKTRSQEKVQLMARLLRSVSLQQDRSRSSPEDYLSVIADLSDREIEVAARLYQLQRGRPLNGENELQFAVRAGWKQFCDEFPAEIQDELAFILLRIQRTGLIHEITGMYLGYGGGIFTITETFRRIMAYLEHS